MAKHTFKKMPGLHRKVFEVCFAIFNNMAKRVNANFHTLKKCFIYSWGVNSAMPNIQDRAFCGNSKSLSAVNYLRKKLHLRCSTECASVCVIFWSNTSCIQLGDIIITSAKNVAHKKSTRFTRFYHLFTTFQQ